MEIIDYTPPTSWTDKNMDWDKPDPMNIDYFMAIYEASKERFIPALYSEARLIISKPLINSSPFFAEVIIDINRYILSLSKFYLNIESLQNIYTTAEIATISHSFWTDNDAQNAMGEMSFRFQTYNSNNAYPSLNMDDVKKWLKSAKEFLQKMKYREIDPQYGSYTYYRKLGSGGAYQGHEPLPAPPRTEIELYNESTQKAIDSYNSMSWEIPLYSIPNFAFIATYLAEPYYIGQTFPLWGTSCGIAAYGTRYVFPATNNYTLYSYGIFSEIETESTTKRVIDTLSTYFPNDTIEMGKYCKLSSLPFVDSVVDLRNLHLPSPNIVLESEVLYSSDGSDTRTYKGCQSGEFRFFADYSTSFNFK